MNKIIFVILATGAIYKFTDLLPNKKFGCYATTQLQKDAYVEFTPDQVEKIAERATQIIQVEIN